MPATMTACSPGVRFLACVTMYIDYFTKNKLIIDHAKGDGMAVIPYIGYLRMFRNEGKPFKLIFLLLSINRLLIGYDMVFVGYVNYRKEIRKSPSQNILTVIYH